VDSPQPKRPCLGPARCETDAERKAREAREAREKAERERLRREANKRRPTCRSNAQKLAIADALGSPLTLIGQAGAKAAGLNLLFKSFNALNAPVVYFYLTGKTFNYLSDC
jgi:hypothetical protein